MHKAFNKQCVENWVSFECRSGSKFTLLGQSCHVSMVNTISGVQCSKESFSILYLCKALLFLSRRMELILNTAKVQDSKRVHHTLCVQIRKDLIVY